MEWVHYLKSKFNLISIFVLILFLLSSVYSATLSTEQYTLLDGMLDTHLNYFLSTTAVTNKGMPVTAYSVDSGDRSRFGYSNTAEWGYLVQAYIAAAERGKISKATALSKITTTLNTLKTLQDTSGQNYNHLFYNYYQVTNTFYPGADLSGMPYHTSDTGVPSGDNALLFLSLVIADGWAKDNNYSTLSTLSQSIYSRMKFNQYIFTEGSKTYVAHLIDGSSGVRGTSKWDVYADEAGLVVIAEYLSESVDFNTFKQMINSQLRSGATWNGVTVDEAAWFNAMFTWGVRSIGGLPVNGTPYSTDSFVPATEGHLLYGNYVSVDYPAFSDIMSQGYVRMFKVPPNNPNEYSSTAPTNSAPHALFIPLNVLPDLKQSTLDILMTKINALKNDTAGYYYGTGSAKPFGFVAASSPYANKTNYTGANPSIGKNVFETLSQAYIALSAFNALQYQDGKKDFKYFLDKVDSVKSKVDSVQTFLYPPIIVCTSDAMCDDSNSQTEDICVNPSTVQSYCRNTLLINTCNDSNDGGLNYFLKGTTSFVKNNSSGSLTDYCLNNSDLNEFYCSPLISSFANSCNYGCRNGACLNNYVCQIDSDCPSDFNMAILDDPNLVGHCIVNSGQGAISDKLVYTYELPMCSEPGTVDASCDEYTHLVNHVVKECPYGCENDACLSAPVCYSDVECGSDTNHALYCDGNNLVQVNNTFTCVNPGTQTAACVKNNGSSLVESCANGCSNAACTIACFNNTQCGTDGLLRNVCIDNYLYNTMRTYTCNNAGASNAYCSQFDSNTFNQTCNYGCLNGVCVNPVCSTDAECNDNNSITTDTCVNPGTVSSSCSNIVPAVRCVDPSYDMQITESMIFCSDYVPFKNMQIVADNVVVDCNGATIFPGYNGVVFTVANRNNVTIKNCNIIREPNASIVVTNSTNVSILNNNFSSSWNSAVAITNSSFVNIINNEFYGSDYGAGLELSGVTDSNILQNKIYNNAYSGIMMNNCQRNNITNNNIFNNPKAIDLRESTLNKFNNNIFCKNNHKSACLNSVNNLALGNKIGPDDNLDCNFLSTQATNCDQNCVDSDTKRDYFTSGFTKVWDGSSYIITNDLCYDAEFLGEQYCDNGYKAVEGKRCDYGCVNNACVDGCTSDLSCDDGNSQTTDACTNPGTQTSLCTHTPLEIECTLDSDCDLATVIHPGCVGNSLYMFMSKDTCFNPGTVSSYCAVVDSNSLNQVCQYGCLNQECLPAPVCSNDSQCNDNNSLTLDTCINPGTQTSVCSHTQTACSTNSDCGTNDWIGGAYGCSGTYNITDKYRTFTCNNPGTLQARCSFVDENRSIGVCTNGQICNSGSVVCVTPECVNDYSCNDNNQWTYDTCLNPNTVQSQCVYTPVAQDCVFPVSDMNILTSVKFCKGVYSVSDLNVAKSNIIIDCDGAKLIGSQNATHDNKTIWINKVSNVVIKNCNIIGGNHSIYLMYDKNISIIDSNINSTADSGIIAYFSSALNIKNNNIIDHPYQSGISFYDVNDSIISNNVINENGTAPSPWSFAGGVYLGNSYRNKIQNNVISKNKVALFIYSGGGNTVSNNSMCLNKDASYCANSSSNTATGNKINSSGGVNCPWLMTNSTVCDQSCSDTDGNILVINSSTGIDHFIAYREYQKGTVTFWNGVESTASSDECLDVNRIHEYYCSNDYLNDDVVTCPIGCVNGACIKPTCSSSFDCNDNNPRTIDTCLNPYAINSTCVNDAVACFNNTECNDNNSQTVDTCINLGTVQSYCQNVKPAIMCSLASQCGTNGYLNTPTCSGSYVKDVYRTYSCSSPGTTASKCSYVDVVKTKQTCLTTQICNAGACVTPVCKTNTQCNDNNVFTLDVCVSPNTINSNCTHTPIACTASTQCGVNAWLNQATCSGNNIGDYFRTFTCKNPGTVNSYCSSVDVLKLRSYCASGTLCSGGVCVKPTCSSNTACNDSNAYTADVCVSPGTLNSVCTHSNIRCLKNVDCNDNSQYTMDVCKSPGLVTSVCVYTPIACTSNAGCDDLNHLTLDTCSSPNTTSSKCNHTSIKCALNTDCEDNNSLTSNVCLNPGTTTSVCKFYPPIPAKLWEVKPNISSLLYFGSATCNTLTKSYCPAEMGWEGRLVNYSFVLPYGDITEGLDLKFYVIYKDYGYTPNVKLKISAGSSLTSLTVVEPSLEIDDLGEFSVRIPTSYFKQGVTNYIQLYGNNITPIGTGRNPPNFKINSISLNQLQLN